jgi:hypothetical protein
MARHSFVAVAPGAGQSIGHPPSSSWSESRRARNPSIVASSKNRRSGGVLEESTERMFRIRRVVQGSVCIGRGRSSLWVDRNDAAGCKRRPQKLQQGLGTFSVGLRLQKLHHGVDLVLAVGERLA